MRQRMSGSALLLTEIIAAVLILSLCSAVCIGLFVRADRLTAESAQLTEAVFAAQSAAEAFKAMPDADGLAALLHGQRTEQGIVADYDENWEKKGEPVYRLLLTVADDGLVARAEITVSTGDAVLYQLSCARPAEGGNGHG